MRLEQLLLTSFGRFEGKALQLSPHGSRLSVVYGPNEAGKSTSLRAYEGLLFGIDSTDDAYLHEPKKLRVGGVIVSDAGERLVLHRRRGRKDTLRDEHDQPIDERRLALLLRGVDRETFRLLYGLDHVRLREGARTLFAKGHGVGESLFEAGLSGARVSQLAKALRAECEAMFTPRARERPLNEALRAFGQANREAREYATQPATYQAQVQGIEQARLDKLEAERELAALEQRRRFLERGRRVAPLLAKRRRLLAELEEVGPFVPLHEGAAEERERATRELRESEEILQQLATERTELERRLAAQPALILPFDPGKERADLAELLGAAREALAKAPVLAQEREELALRLSGPRRMVAEPDVAQERELLELVAARDDARRAKERASEQEREERAVVSQLAGRLAALRARSLPAIEALSLLVEEGERALLRAERREAERVKAEDRMAAARQRFERLGAKGSLEDVRAQPGPAVEVWSALIKRCEQAQRAMAEASSRSQEAALVFATQTSELERLRARGPLISEADLARERSARDAALEEALADPSESRRRHVRELVKTADATSDRLRFEADRLARLSALELTVRELGSAHDQQRARALAHEREHQAARRELSELLEQIGAPELPPELVASWLSRREEVSQALAQAQAARQAMAELDAQAESLARELIVALPGVAHPAEPPFDGLRVLLSVARVQLAEALELRAQIARLLADHEAAEGACTRATARREVCEQAEARAIETLSRELERWALPDGARREDVARAAHEARRDKELLRHMRKLDEEWQARASIEERLRVRAHEIAAALGREPDGELVALAAELSAELGRAQQQLEQRRELEHKRAELAQREAAAVERARGARVVLEIARERAGVARLSDLPLAEQKSAQGARLSTQLEVTLDALLVASDGSAVSELEASYADFDPDKAENEDEYEQERAALERRREAAAHQRVGLEQALEHMDESRAADKAELAAEHLARAKTYAERYMRLRLALSLLERQVKSYQAEHQAPLVAATSRYFHALTEGAFEGVSVTLDEDDQPELVAKRGRDELPVSGLSDGTKDQLYLALRLASIVRHARGVESLPLVLDDVLIHFDEQRARAALSLFAELSGAMQVLLFTHQARVVELARGMADARVEIVSLEM